MIDKNAKRLLAKVMGWSDEEPVLSELPSLLLLADYKYDRYQQFAPGRRFLESLALWLKQFKPEDRETAFRFVTNQLVYISDAEFSHLVVAAYPDLIVQERIRLVSEEFEIPSFRVGEICHHKRFRELQLKSLYLGLSDGARTNELRRASRGEVGNEQIWQAYELGDTKSTDMLDHLGKSLMSQGYGGADPRFNVIWLLDDFSGSGNTYIRFDPKTREYKGKIKKVYEQLHEGHLVDTSHYDVFLLLYVATSQAIDHIQYWSERFAGERGYKPLQLRVMWPLRRDLALDASSPDVAPLLDNAYNDLSVVDSHFEIGGTKDPRLGFAGCALPLVLCHNTPNNSIFALSGPETSEEFFGLFPRVSRHREF